MQQTVVMPSKTQPMSWAKQALEFRELTPDRWSDLEALFGARGACGGCWCMLWRLKRSEFEKQKGAQNKAAFKAVVDSGEAPGILAYANGSPIGWCALAPRETYPALDRSRVLKRIDDKPVWSIVCLFIARPYRRKGVSVELLKAAADYVRKRGGKIVEGYPVEPRKDEMPDVFAWTGLASAFLNAGFVECERRSETRPIMRRETRSRK
jgi:GNAT superfamily N-acetyltransferase